MTALAVLSIVLLSDDTVIAAERVGRLDEPAIREASGIVASRRHPGIFWAHNDSGNPPRLFAVRRDGSLVREFSVGVPNLDWEDIATDDRGHLYIGEIGNNDGRLPLRAVYILDEPDPRGPPVGGGLAALAVTSAVYYRFPTGGKFDAEGLAIDGDRALIVAKTFDNRAAEVYALPLRPPAPLFKPALPRLVGTLEGFTEPVTGADLTASGRLVVCSLNRVGIYQKQADASWLPVALFEHRADNSTEAVAWDGDDLILTGERRGVFRIAARDWRRVATGLGRSPALKGGTKR